MVTGHRHCHPGSATSLRTKDAMGLLKMIFILKKLKKKKKKKQRQLKCLNLRFTYLNSLVCSFCRNNIIRILSYYLKPVNA